MLVCTYPSNAKNNDIKLWKDRTTELKRVYARVDPEELEKAQKDLAAAKASEANAKREAAAALNAHVMVVDEEHPRPNLAISIPMAIRAGLLEVALSLEP